MKPMFRAKPKKSLADKTPFTVFEIHSRPLTDRPNIWTQGYYQVVSVDPAWKNFAVRVGRRHADGRIDSPLLFAKYDFTTFDKARDDDKDSVFFGYGAALAQFQQWLPLLLESHIVMVERQLPDNYKATRMMQHFLSFCITNLRDAPLMPMIMEVDPQLKGKMLGAPKGCRGQDLKKWAVEKGIELLTVRNDQVSLDILAKMKKAKHKLDDVLDTVVQEEAWFMYNGLPTTQLPPRQGVYEPIVPPIRPVPVTPSMGPRLTIRPIVEDPSVTTNPSGVSLQQFLQYNVPGTGHTTHSTPGHGSAVKLRLVPSMTDR